MPDELPNDYMLGISLPDDAVVVRGAPMTLDLLRSSAGRPVKRHGFYGLSMFAFPDADADEVARSARIPHEEICESTVGDIRAAGFEVERTFRKAGHCSLKFADEPTEEELATVLELFEPCKVNEYRRSE